jgi:hypothetical protein
MNRQRTRISSDRDIFLVFDRLANSRAAAASPIDTSAVSAAKARLKRAADQCQQRRELTNEEYYGGGRREASLCKIEYQGSLAGIVTRNHYGCLVLNSSNALFIDVDLPSSGQCTTPVQPALPLHGTSQRTLDDLVLVLASEIDQGYRIYRTAAGFRVLATSQRFQPGSPLSERLMEATGADAAFVRLCRTQKSFRARLSPKPWRCGLRRPPHVFSQSFEQKCNFDDWLATYERSCRNFATCRYLGTIGPKSIDDCIAPIVELHDRESKAFDRQPLA